MVVIWKQYCRISQKIEHFNTENIPQYLGRLSVINCQTQDPLSFTQLHCLPVSPRTRQLSQELYHTGIGHAFQNPCTPIPPNFDLPYFFVDSRSADLQPLNSNRTF